MNIVVDTSVWSCVLRRPEGRNASLRRELEALIDEGRVIMLGPIRQELLSGLRTDRQFEKLKAALEPFLDHALVHEDYEYAAKCFNTCRRKGIQGSNTDFLICAVAKRYGFEVFTVDRDFEAFERALRLKLYKQRFANK